MFTKKVVKLKTMLRWSRYSIYRFLAIIVFTVALYEIFDLHWLRIPWTPLALIGTAVAFVIGLQNNSAYSRIWEARIIWGGVVNTSRTFGMYVKDMVTNRHRETKLDDAATQELIKTLTYRHIAWLTALRHAMRESRPWETVMESRTNREWRSKVHPPEWDTPLEEDLKPYLSEDELAHVMKLNNKQTAILYLQSHHLRKLMEEGGIWEFTFLQLERVLEELFTLQGKSERIKNFPYPRHFATLNHYFMWVFVLLMPWGVVPMFSEIGDQLIPDRQGVGEFFIWLSVPFYVVVAWVFHTMERIGRTGDNPFEGSVNDVPISTIARAIEIDLRQNLGETLDEIPEQFPVRHNTQM